MNHNMTQSQPCDDIALEPGFASNHTVLIQEAVDACAAAGGGRVVLKAGRYDSGTISLRSGVTLHLEKGAVLTASTNIDDFLCKEGMPTALIFADQAENIGLTGEGTVDGSARAIRRKKDIIPDWVEEKKVYGTWIPAFEVTSGKRPISLIHFADCRHVRMEGVRVEDSPRWTIHFAGCSELVIRGLTVRSPAEASNGDGIDLDGCSDVLVEDCDIETGDDAICLKSSRTWGLERACRNIIIRRCRAFSTTHGFCIGHDTQDDFENIDVSDLEIGGVGKYPNLTGIGIGSVDGGSIRGLKLSNIRMQNVVAPFQIRLSHEGKIFRGHNPEAPYHLRQPGKRPPGEIRDILLEDITVKGASGNSFISGLPGHPLHQIIFRNVRVECVGTADPARIFHVVPELESEYPRSEIWRFLPSYGFFCRHIDGLEFSDVEITTKEKEKRPALMFKDVSSFHCRDVKMD